MNAEGLGLVGTISPERGRVNNCPGCEGEGQ